MDLLQEIASFIEASIICFPALLAVSWVIFLVIQRFAFSRPAAVITSCVLASAMSVGLQVQGRNSLEPQPNIGYEIVKLILVTIIGLVFWRKRKPKLPAADSDPTPRSSLSVRSTMKITHYQRGVNEKS